MGKSAARHFLVTVSGKEVPGYWATKTGGEVQSTIGKVWDGGASEPDLLAGPIDYTDLTLGRPYDVDRDAPVAAAMRPLVGKTDRTITVQPTDENYIKVGKPTTYVGKLSRVVEPEVDASSATEARIQLVFAIRRVS